MATQRIPTKMLNRLREARKAATLANASFNAPTPSVFIKGATLKDPDSYIKETVRLHHSTWIIGPLDVVINWAEGKPPL